MSQNGMIIKELFSALHFLRWKLAAPRGDRIPKRKTIVTWHILAWSSNIMKARVAWMWMTCSFLYTMCIYKHGKDGTWRLSPISSTFVMSTVGCSIEDTVSNCDSRKRINTICYSLWRVQQMLYCLLERSPSEQSQEDQKSEHHPLHVQVKKKTMVPKRAVDICYDGIYHWPEFGDERNRCRVCSMLSFVYWSKCQI